MLLFQGKKRGSQKTEEQEWPEISLGGPQIGPTSCKICKPKQKQFLWPHDQDKREQY